MCLFYTKQTKETKNSVVRRLVSGAPPSYLWCPAPLLPDDNN
jgi:hypothetical protein